MIGILNIDKPPGISSHDVVNRVRRRLGTKRVGHAGTLDPVATGVLVVAVGPATRFLQYLPLEPKTYVATVRFGQSTPSFDCETEPDSTLPVPDSLIKVIDGHLPNFVGTLDQLPPMYSAVKQGGQALYNLARQGLVVDRPTRRIFVKSFDRLCNQEADVDFRIVCSGGTYIRTLAHDLGQAIGCGGHIIALRRTHVGEFSVEQSKDLELVTEEDLIPLQTCLGPIPVSILDAAQADHIWQGRTIASTDSGSSEFVALAHSNGQIIGMSRRDGNQLRPECVIPREALSNV